MLIFWIVAIILFAFTLTFLLLPLLKPSVKVSEEGENERVIVFQQQFEEIAQDNRNGVLDEAQYAIAKSELERRMLNEVGTKNSTFKAVKQDRALAIALTVLLPLLSIIVYFKIGNPDSITIPPVLPSLVSHTSPVEHNSMGGDFEPLLNGLKAKLEINPEDGEGWALLARTYVELRRHSDAVIAYEKATQLIADDPQLYADYADALAVVNEHNLTGKPEELVNKALQLDPHHFKALMLGGTAAYDRKDYKQAIKLWERLQKILPADSEILPDVKAGLVETYALLGEKPPVVLSEQNSSTLPTASASIKGTVRLAPALLNQLNPTDTLFVFARPTQGKPMPVAIVRATANDLPYAYKLDDSSAIMPTHKLSQTSEVVIVARISKSGDAKSQSGDLQGVSPVVKLNESIDIEINEVVK